jgi:hypothetical protein
LREWAYRARERIANSHADCFKRPGVGNAQHGAGAFEMVGDAGSRFGAIVGGDGVIIQMLTFATAFCSAITSKKMVNICS